MGENKNDRGEFERMIQRLADGDNATLDEFKKRLRKAGYVSEIIEEIVKRASEGDTERAARLLGVNDAASPARIYIPLLIFGSIAVVVLFTLDEIVAKFQISSDLLSWVPAMGIGLFLAMAACFWRSQKLARTLCWIGVGLSVAVLLAGGVAYLLQATTTIVVGLALSGAIGALAGVILVKAL